ncbi:MAG: ABC transporter ATP-binding protein [Gemmataceae bacterium]|nr:ABC transporter ATP-binding protein [Gemmataceae bacterium]
MRAGNLHKTYRKNAVCTPVLLGVDFEVNQGEFLSIVGPSGCGKSTLIHLLGTLDKPDQGEVYFRNQRIDNLPSSQRDHLRNREFGFIFQFYHLLPELTTLENVLMPLMIRHSTLGWLTARWRAIKKAKDLLGKVGLGHRMNHLPKELSGGELQRTAIARALIGDPALLFADEPTGNLDESTGNGIFDTLRGLNQIDGVTIIMVTHNLDIASTTHRTIRLAAGQVESAEPAPARVHPWVFDPRNEGPLRQTGG